MYMILAPVSSSVIRGVGYYANTLTVKFHTGRSCDHPVVPESVDLELTNAPSMVRMTTVAFVADIKEET